MNFVFEWIDTGDEEPFARRGKMSIRNLITEGTYFKKLSAIRSFMYDLLDAIDAVNSKGIMHRDIKPSNVLISKTGQVKLIDFDLAEFLNPTTRYQYAVATRGFKPPEI